MRRVALCSAFALALSGLAACASSSRAARGSSDAAASPTTIRIEGATESIALTTVPSTKMARATIDAPIDSVWRALTTVYQTLEIPVTILLTDQRVIGNDAAKVRRRLHGEPLTRYLDCGSSLGMQNAATYAITMSIRTQLAPDATGGTTVLTRIDATAVSPNYSNSAVSCSSTGVLEKQIVTMLEEQVRK